MELELVKPNHSLKKEFQSLVWDYIYSKETFYMNIYLDALDDFDKYLEELDNNANDIDIPKGWIGYTTYWLTKKESNILSVVGNFRIRHKAIRGAGHIGYDIRPSERGQGFGQKILELGLVEALSFDFDEVLITCCSENESSRKIIERCNGELIRTFYDDESSENRLEYKVTL